MTQYSSVKKVLIVEANRMHSMTLQAELEQLGHRVHRFGNIEALSKVDVGTMDTAIIDLRLSDGAVLGQELKRKHPAMKIIFITGFPIEGNLLGILPGAHVLTKPLNMKALVQLL